MHTIMDYKRAGKKAGVPWASEYLRTGCPHRATARQALWSAGVKSKGLNDALSLLGIPVVFVLACVVPFKLHVWFGLGWPLPWSAGLHGTVIGLGYGPFHKIGVDFHGDPFGPDGYFTKAQLAKNAKDAAARAKKKAKKAAALEGAPA